MTPSRAQRGVMEGHSFLIVHKKLPPSHLPQSRRKAHKVGDACCRARLLSGQFLRKLSPRK